jgi:hypothetical protein
MRLLTCLLALAAVSAVAGPDLTAPPIQELRSEWLREKAGLESARTRAYREMLESRRDEAEAEYQEKLLARNVKGVSIARKTKEVCEDALATIKTNGQFVVPGSLRRELTDWAKKLEADKEAADQQVVVSLAKLREKYLARLGDMLARESGGQAPPPAELEALFETLISAEPKPTASPPPPSATNLPPAAAANATNAPPPVSPWIAASGEGSNWFTVGRWTAAMMAQDVFSIPILNATSSYQNVKSHPFTEQTSQTSYEVIRALTSRDGNRYAFRLKRVTGRLPVTLLSWPSARNHGNLEFRTQPSSVVPSPHGFEIEACVIGQEKTEAENPPVLLETVPPGARIQFNGKRVIDSQGNDTLTPVRLRIPPGTNSLILSLDDHVTKIFDKWSPKPGSRVEWKFVHESDLPPTKTLKLEAPPKTWIPTGLLLHMGDRVWIVPSGQWTIGRKGELCGSEGYPDVPRFAHYYVAGSTLRQVDTAPYGALLVRVGPSGDAIAVTNTVCVSASAMGALFLDVNEKADKDLRKDNRGIMNVKLVLIPAAP